MADTSLVPIEDRDTEVALDGLAAGMNADYAAMLGTFRESIERAERIGKKLIEAKRLVGHGHWRDWVKTNCRFSLKTAQNCMRLHREISEDPEKAQRVAFLPLRQALADLRPKRSKKRRPKKGTQRTAQSARRMAGSRSTDPEHSDLLLEAGWEAIWRRTRRLERDLKGENNRRADSAVLSRQDANVLAGLRLFAKVSAEQIARVASADEDLNLEEIAAHLADAAVVESKLSD